MLDITTSMLTSEENFTRLQSYTSGTAEQVLEWGGLSWLALSILNLGGSGGMLPREICKILVPEWLTMQCGPCTCSHVTAMPIKGLPTGTFLLAQSEFRSRNGWKYRICRRFISYKFRCRKFSSAHCRLSPFRSQRVAVSRPCRLSEFTPYRVLLVIHWWASGSDHFMQAYLVTIACSQCRDPTATYGECSSCLICNMNFISGKTDASNTAGRENVEM